MVARGAGGPDLVSCAFGYSQTASVIALGDPSTQRLPEGSTARPTGPPAANKRALVIVTRGAGDPDTESSALVYSVTVLAFECSTHKLPDESNASPASPTSSSAGRHVITTEG